MDFIRLFSDVCMRQDWRFDGTVITVALLGGRKQQVFVESFGFDGEEMARLFTLIGPLKELSETRLSAVLGLNFSLTFGALASSGSDLILTDTVLLRTASHDQLAFTIRYLAETADGYEKQIFGRDEN